MRPAIGLKPTQQAWVNNWVRGAGGREHGWRGGDRSHSFVCRTRWQPAQLPTMSQLETAVKPGASGLELAEHEAAVVAAKAKRVGQRDIDVRRLLLLAHQDVQVCRLLGVVQVQVGVQEACGRGTAKGNQLVVEVEVRVQEACRRKTADGSQLVLP